MIGSQNGFESGNCPGNIPLIEKACCLNCRHCGIRHVKDYFLVEYICMEDDVSVVLDTLETEKPCFEMHPKCGNCKWATRNTSVIDTNCLKRHVKINVFDSFDCFEPRIVYKERNVTNCNTLLSSTLMGKPLLDGFVVPETVITEEDCKIVSVTVALNENTDILYNPVSRRLTFKYHDEV